MIVEPYINGFATKGSYFTYQGVRYGYGTKVLFKDEFYIRHREVIGRIYEGNKFFGPRWNYFRTFNSITEKNGKKQWTFNFPFSRAYDDIDPERDIEKIITPVWYMEPKELVKLRLRSGVWFWFVWKQTLIYALCLLISPIFQEWYLIWTIGLYMYLRLCYIELSKGGFNRGW